MYIKAFRECLERIIQENEKDIILKNRQLGKVFTKGFDEDLLGNKFEIDDVITLLEYFTIGLHIQINLEYRVQSNKHVSTFIKY